MTFFGPQSLGQDSSFPNQQMAQFWSEDFAQRMVKVLYKAHEEDKHYSNENESDESGYSYESDDFSGLNRG